MKIYFPFLNTPPEKDLSWVLALTPLWWALGFNVFVYHLVSFLVFSRSFGKGLVRGKKIMMPKRLYPFAALLFFYLISIVINIPLRPAQRIFASLNNYSMLVMGMMVMLAVYNSRPAEMLGQLITACRWLCFASGILAFLSLGLWLLGYDNLSIEPLLMKLIPKLAAFPYFNSLMIMKLTVTEWMFGETPRLSLYSGAPTATGGLVLMILPLMLTYYQLEKRRVFECAVMIGFSLFVLLFSQSRSAVCGALAAVVFVEIMSRRHKLLIGLFALLLTLVLSGLIYQGVEWMLNIRTASNVGRLILYQEALEIVREENFLLGIGVRLRDDFTMMTIGSHACYVEIIFVAGIVGLVLFLGFQMMVALEWLDQQKYLKDETSKILWKGLGLSFLGTNLWLMTDTIFAFPYIAFTYFLTAGSLFLFGKNVRLGHLFEWRKGQLIGITERMP